MVQEVRTPGHQSLSGSIPNAGSLTCKDSLSKIIITLNKKNNTNIDRNYFNYNYKFNLYRTFQNTQRHLNSQKKRK